MRSEWFFSETERRQLCFYARNCATGALAAQAEPVLAEFAHYFTGRKLHEPDEDCPGPVWRSTRHIVRSLSKYRDWPDDGASYEQNVLFAQQEFQLDEGELEILRLVLRYERNHGLEIFSDQLLGRLESLHRAVAALTGLTPADAHKRIVPLGRLLDSGVLILNTDDPNGLAGPGGALHLAPPLRKIMSRPYETREEWAAAIFGHPLTPTLVWDDYAHIGEMRDLAARLLQGVQRQPANGINLLLHGPTGTGKTEFCKTVAAKAGMQVWSVGESDDEGGEPTRGERLAALKLAQRLLAKKSGALILLDESEDIIEETGRFSGTRLTRNGSKVHVNRFLEQNPVPVLWTCNSLDDMEPTVLRRMSLIVEFPIPNVQVRSRILSRHIKHAGMNFDSETLRRLAAYNAAPAVVANAALVAKVTGGGAPDFEKAVDSMLRAIGQTPRAPVVEADSFDTALVHCSENIGELVRTLTREGAALDWSMCIDGPPGCGKSLFARYVASRIGLEVIHKRASDLISMYVGQSEKEIARAFADARSRRAMLIFDEADSFLCDRRSAVRSWEITQVNEMWRIRQQNRMWRWWRSSLAFVPGGESDRARMAPGREIDKPRICECTISICRIMRGPSAKQPADSKEQQASRRAEDRRHRPVEEKRSRAGDRRVLLQQRFTCR